MNTASLEGALKIFLIFLLIYFGIKIIIKYFGPMILRYFMKRMGKSISKKFYEQQQNAAGRKSREGEVTIEKKPPRHKKTNNNTGEYVDYEEID